MIRQRVLTALSTAVLAAGCLSHYHIPYRPGTQPGAPSGGHPFDYQPGPIESRQRELPELATARYRVREVHLPSHGRNGQPENRVGLRYYTSTEPGRRPTVLILPVWGTYTYPPEKMARELRTRSKGSTNIILMLGERFLFDWDAMAEAENEAQFVALAAAGAEHVLTTVIDVRRLVDWAVAQPETDPERMGLIGFSMGAFVASLVLPSEPRLSAGVVIMGAAHPGTIFATCRGRVGEVRELALQRFGWTRQEYQALFDELFARGDPADFGGRVTPESILMVDAHRDECMPRSARDALWEALGRPERISLRYSHKMSFLAMTPLGFNFIGRRTYRFLHNTLD